MSGLAGSAAVVHCHRTGRWVGQEDGGVMRHGQLQRHLTSRSSSRHAGMLNALGSLAFAYSFAQVRATGSRRQRGLHSCPVHGMCMACS